MMRMLPKRRSYPSDVAGMEDVIETGQMLSEREIRGWPIAYLNHARQYEGRCTPFNRGLIEKEWDRRKAWEAPAARSAKVASIALGVSVLSLLIAVAAFYQAGYSETEVPNQAELGTQTG